MKYSVAQFELLVEQGFLRKSEKGDLVLYGYTDKCTFERHWNEYTTVARGLILNRHTGQVVAKPFPKFFNLGEMPETSLANLPKDDKYQVFEKLDGSLGIVFHHEGEWHVATRGSFHSEQAVRGREILNKYNLKWLYPGWTYLVEIIYPENKIIIDYKGESKLVFLGAYLNSTCEETVRDETTDQGSWGRFLSSGIPFAKKYDLTIEQMVELQKTLPKDQEGFVVRFSNGLRVKIKGDEYMRIAKIISQMSPISFWESMVEGVVNRDYLAQIPEEFRNEYEPMVDELEGQYADIMTEICYEFSKLPTHKTTPEDRKIVGLFLKDSDAIKHKAVMFPLLTRNNKNVDKYIMKLIRPTGNVMKDFLHETFG